MKWQMNPFLMPPSFCIAQTILTGLGFFLTTGVTTAFAYESVFKAKERDIGRSSVSLPWRPLFIIPVIVYPLASSLVQIILVLLLEAVEPTDDLQCDATHPLWVRFLGYAGNPLAFSLTFFIISLLFDFWFQRYTKFPHVANSNLTALPPRNRGKGRRLQTSPRPFPLAILAQPPLPSPHSTASRRVPISPGFVSPVLSARQFHLPFTPLSPTFNDGEGEPDASPESVHKHDYITDATRAHTEQSVVSSIPPHSVSSSPVRNELSLPPGQRTVRQKESNDFLKYLNEYKEKERHSSESDIEKVSRDAQYTQKSGTPDWDDVSSLRWNREDDDFETAETSFYLDHWSSSWADGALRKLVGGQHGTGLGAGRSDLIRNSAHSGLKVTEDSESYYLTAEEGESRAQRSRDYDSLENEELFQRNTDARQRSTTVIEGMNNQSEEQTSKNSITWRIIKIQLPITLVLLLATLSTLIDVINQAINPSSPSTPTSFPQPTPFGTHHIALLLLVWGPVFAFGRLPVVRQKLLFFRKSSELVIHA
ncbi:hypothetical protein E1B28_008316 [Marasmius oreades]|nr:uncharacterized protein E1B28_008316 [Marasmius oreades]KAG7091922.1 hypothetical protein E1B28_008316 [Marasmius oreades]